MKGRCLMKCERRRHVERNDEEGEERECGKKKVCLCWMQRWKLWTFWVRWRNLVILVIVFTVLVYAWSSSS